MDSVNFSQILNGNGYLTELFNKLQHLLSLKQPGEV